LKCENPVEFYASYDWTTRYSKICEDVEEDRMDDRSRKNEADIEPLGED